MNALAAELSAEQDQTVKAVEDEEIEIARWIGEGGADLPYPEEILIERLARKKRLKLRYIS
jgi:hypothetical protein